MALLHQDADMPSETEDRCRHKHSILRSIVYFVLCRVLLKSVEVRCYCIRSEAVLSALYPSGCTQEACYKVIFGCKERNRYFGLVLLGT